MPPQPLPAQNLLTVAIFSVMSFFPRLFKLLRSAIVLGLLALLLVVFLSPARSEFRVQNSEFRIQSRGWVSLPFSKFRQKARGNRQEEIGKRVALISASSHPRVPAPPKTQSPNLPVSQLSPTSPNFLQQGRQLYQSEQFAEAIAVWRQAEQFYTSQGEIFHRVQALNYLALAYQELGEWDEAESAIAASLDLLKQLEQRDRSGTALLAQALNNLGSLQLARGQTQAALETWQQAEATYETADNTPGRLGSQINQAQALQALGQYRRAQTLLEQLIEQLQKQPDSALKAEGLRSLGIALQTTGDLLRSKEILEDSWAIGKQIPEETDLSATLFAIGNIARDLQQPDVALAYYREATQTTQNPIAIAQIQLNQLRVLVETQQREDALAIISQLEASLANLAPSRTSIYARVNFAQSLLEMRPAGLSQPQIAKILAAGVQQAKELRDRRAEAYSLVQLGNLYERSQQWGEARDLTRQCLQLSRSVNAADISARAAWQLGRILKQQGDRPSAIAAYQEAFENLQLLRSDLVAVDTDLKFTFTDSVEPLYRELVSLLLDEEASQERLQQARKVLEALQIAELDDFFRDACLDAQPVEIDRIDTQAAVIYPIILRDRLEVILSLPDRPLRHYATHLPHEQIERTLQNLYSSLYPGYSDRDRLLFSQQVYDWLLRPAEDELNRNKIEALVFVLDGFLRNLPMTVLYDGRQYLVEKYSLALSPGLQLFPEGLQGKELKTLTVGLTEARQGFPALPGVNREVQEIITTVDSTVLLNRQFTRANFQNLVQNENFPVVHLATHGQFSSNPEDTFLLTWNDRIGVDDFDRLFQRSGRARKNPIELLVLSACQTATGDRRATLGLAGLALRSGARSTIASLWSVNDRSTSDLMSAFYHQLTQPGRKIAKAEALRQAQLTLLRTPQYSHPYFWASFVLIGNWL